MRERRARVLVIEDDADTRDFLCTLLATEGHEAVGAEDGEEGIARYRREPCDIVVVDMFMPRKDGLTTIRELRAEFPDAVIVAMSADGRAEEQNMLTRARMAGAILTFHKPFEPWVLLRALEGLVAGRAALITSRAS